MGKFIFRLILMMVGVYASAQFISGVSVESFLAVLIAGVSFIVVYEIIKPILKVLTLPLNILTFGLFAVVLNAIMFFLVGKFIAGFSVDTFLAAFFGSIIVTILDRIADKVNKKR